MSLKAPRPDITLIDKPLDKWSVKLLALATAVAGLEPFVEPLRSVLPPHWYAYTFPAILIARIIRQTIEAQ